MDRPPKRYADPCRGRTAPLREMLTLVCRMTAFLSTQIQGCLSSFSVVPQSGASQLPECQDERSVPCCYADLTHISSGSRAWRSVYTGELLSPGPDSKPHFEKHHPKETLIWQNQWVPGSKKFGDRLGVGRLAWEPSSWSSSSFGTLSRPHKLPSRKCDIYIHIWNIFQL